LHNSSFCFPSPIRKRVREIEREREARYANNERAHDKQ
jgi:hypothetical protein